MKKHSIMLLRFFVFIGTLWVDIPAAFSQGTPKIDTFRSPNGKWSIDHYSKDNGWQASHLALRDTDSANSKKFATIEAAIQGGPIWSTDSKIVVFNTGYSTYMDPIIFQIQESGVIKEIKPFAAFASKAQLNGRIPNEEEIAYDTGHIYFRCRYFDKATNSFWFTFQGNYALKRQREPQHARKNFVVSLNASSLAFSFHDDLPRPIDPAPPARPASIGLRTTGTGFVIDSVGHVMTCHHVVDGAAFIKLDSETASYDAFVVFADPELDVAVLQTSKPPGLEPLPLELSKDPELGDEVFTIGFPNTNLQGFTPKYTRGEISALAGPADDPNYMQISTPVQPGNSGGALVTTDGIVVGMVAAKLNAALAAQVTGDIAQNVNYALRVTKLSKLLKKWRLAAPAIQPASNAKQSIQRTRQSTLRISTYGK